MSKDSLPPATDEAFHAGVAEESSDGTVIESQGTQEPDDGEAGEVGEEEGHSAPSSAPAWIISAAVHGVLAFFFWYMVFATKQPEVELPPMHVPTIHAPTKQEVKQESRDVDAKIEVAIKEADTVAPIDTLNLPTEEKAASEENTEAEVNKGREEAVADTEMGSTGAFSAIGAAGGGAGMFGSRTGGGKRRALAKGGGTTRTESAVDLALRWFKRHQSPNGIWDFKLYQANCMEAPKCEPGTFNNPGVDVNVAMTGYALLCFLGAGYDHKTPTKYKATVAKGLEYLRSVQKADGSFGLCNYEHAVATMALAEAYALTRDPELRSPTQAAVKIILSRQTKDPKSADQAYAGLGWNYLGPDPGRIDSSVSGWSVMALKSALGAGLPIGGAMESSKKWLERAWKAANPGWKSLTDPYTSVSAFPYLWNSTTDAVEVHPAGTGPGDLVPVGALCAVFLGHHSGDMMLESLCNHIMKYQLPTAYPCNTYYLYYDTLAIFQAGGDRWKTWNHSMRDFLVNAQRRGDGCFDGSWDWVNTIFPGNDTGRILSTAYCCLSLEVYYRYKQVGADPKGGLQK